MHHPDFLPFLPIDDDSSAVSSGFSQINQPLPTVKKVENHFKQIKQRSVCSPRMSIVRCARLPLPSCLVPISLSNAANSINFVQENTILFAQIVSTSFCSQSIHFLLKDMNGDTLQATFRHPEHSIINQLTLNRYVAIVEPLLVKDNVNDEILLLQIDHPDGIVAFSNHEDWLMVQDLPCDLEPTAEFLKEKGNKLFVNSNFYQSLWYYLRALKLTDNGALTAILYSNCAAACLKMERWDEAYDFASKALSVDPLHKKAAFRRLSAALMMGKFEELTSNCWDLLSPKESRDLRIKFEVAKKESLGIFDLPLICNEFVFKGTIDPYHSDYMSSLVEVATFPNKGRGIRATKKLKPRTLILASKAFVFSPSAEDVTTGDAQQLTTQSINKLQVLSKDHEHRKLLLSLSSFSRIPSKQQSESLMVNSDKISQIIAFNWFGSSPFGYRGTLVPRLNSFHAAGLWLKPSLFNHSCCPNCSYFTIGEFIFIYTSGSVAAGEELCFPYVLLDDPYSVRRQQLANICLGQGFECKCDRCVVKSQYEDIERNVFDAFQHVTLKGWGPFDPVERLITKEKRLVAIKLLRSLPSSVTIGLIPVLFLEGLDEKCSLRTSSACSLLSECLDRISRANLENSLALWMVAARCRTTLIEIGHGQGDVYIVKSNLIALELMLVVRGGHSRRDFLSYLATMVSKDCFIACELILQTVPYLKQFFV
ncbi:hypothetical protein RCL1_006886 [Eukaryota sp. TZLM3-RCL]